MRKTWTVGDFVLIWIGGTAMSVAVAAMVVDAEFSAGVNTLFILGGQYIGILVGFWLVSRRRREAEPINLSLEIGDLKYVGLGMGLQIVASLLLQPIARIFYPDGRPPQEIADIIGSTDTGSAVRVALFGAAVLLAPFTEELMYRGVLFKAVRPLGAWVAIVATAVVFTSVHVLGLDPNNRAGSAAIVLPPLFALAILLGWLTERTGRLGPALFLHSGWNLLAAALLLIPADLLEAG